MGIFRRLAAVVLTVLILCAILPLALVPTSALTPSYTLGNAYRSERFYSQLLKVPLTGDFRRDVIAVALSQVGYHEGDSDEQMHGTNTSGSRNYVEYTRIYGKLDNGEGNGMSYGYAWCAAFVSWCMRQAGVPTAKVTTEVSCPRMITWLLERSLYRTRASGYIPQTGDMIFFKDATSKATSTHIGLVVGTSEGKVWTVEGNSGNEVATRSYSLTDSYIVGYGTPDYGGTPGTAYDFPLTATRKSTGDYRVTSSELNVRGGAGTSFPILETLRKGACVTVTAIDGKWGKIERDGADGWISLSYTVMDFTHTSTVSLHANGGEFDTPLQTQTQYAHTALTLQTAVPHRTGHDFLGWAEEPGAAVATMQPGDLLPADRGDRTLYAVWKASSVAVRLYDWDGRPLFVEGVDYGSDLNRLEIPVPTRAPDGENEYTFAGWEPALPTALTMPFSAKAVYTASPIETHSGEPVTEIYTEAPTEPPHDGEASDETVDEISETATEGTTDGEADGGEVRSGCGAAVSIPLLPMLFVWLLKKKNKKG